jgi:hypothetical protein
MNAPRVGARNVTFRGDGQLRCNAVVTYDDLSGFVYIEVVSKHDDVIVHNTVRVERVEFSQKIRRLGCL